MIRSPPLAAADSLFQYPAFLSFWWAGIASSFAFQMVSVAVGWQVYAITGRAFDLGLIGLVQFVPSVLVGGIGTLLVVGLWMAMFPTLRKRQKLEGS